MSDGAIIAIVAAIQVVLLAIVQSILASRGKKEDYARQDEVAARAERNARQVSESAKAAVEATQLVAQKVEESNEQSRLQLKTIDESTQKIHILVNSEMTAARTNERDQTRLLLVALKRVQTVSREHLGIEPTSDEIEAITAAEERIMELDRILADRLAAQHRVDAAVATKKEQP